MSRRIHLANREDKFVKNKGILCLDGYLGNYKKDVVFVKKVPKVKEFLPIKEVYKRFSDNLYVIRQITVESANYEYMAYEKMDGTLVDLVGAHMDDERLTNSTKIKILRGVVRALVELRADDILHLNICPENVLLKSGKGGDYTVKLCGMGASRDSEIN
ncbi:glutamine--tRNA ligase [Tanacetum coccineum]